MKKKNTKTDMKREEAIEVIKELQPNDRLREALRTLIPELRESEDERTRKEIVGFIDKVLKDKNVLLLVADRIGDNIPSMIPSWIAYLEKQKEQEPLDIPSAGSGAQGTTPPSFKLDVKPTEWSEEEMKVLDSIIDDYEKTAKSFCGYDGKIGFLKAIRDGEYDLPKQQWSEEDKEMLFFLNEFMDNKGKDYFSTHAYPKIKIWLESLRPQPNKDVLPSLSEKEIICLKRALDYLRKEHNRYGGEDFTNEIAVLEWLITHPVLTRRWKPSEEQMDALNSSHHFTKEGRELLKTLYRDINENLM